MSNDASKEPFRVPVRLFELGTVVATPGALAATTHEQRLECLGRHISGDWGVVCAEDRKANFEALFEDLRILSAYPVDPARPSKAARRCRPAEAIPISGSATFIRRGR